MELGLVQARQLIYDALDTLNDELPDEEKVELAESTALFGPSSFIDSLSLVSLIVDVETALNQLMGRHVSLTDERAMDRDVLPFSTVATLAEYIVELTSDNL